jgi:hypothetical protein
MDIDVVSVCGEDIISRDAGRKIRDLILAAWNEKEIRILVKGRLIASVSFFDEAIGLLLRRGKTIDEIRKKISFPDLQPNDRQLLNRIIKERIEEHYEG